MPTTEKTTREGGTAPLTIADLPRALRHLTREDLLAALQVNDPNGCYTDALGAAEGYPPLTEEQAVTGLLGDGADTLAWLIAHYGRAEGDSLLPLPSPEAHGLAETVFELVLPVSVGALMHRMMDETRQSGSARDRVRELFVQLAHEVERAAQAKGGWEAHDWYETTEAASTALALCIMDAPGARTYWGYPDRAPLSAIAGESLR